MSLDFRSISYRFSTDFSAFTKYLNQIGKREVTQSINGEEDNHQEDREEEDRREEEAAGSSGIIIIIIIIIIIATPLQVRRSELEQEE